jgi:hypothetical protein
MNKKQLDAMLYCLSDERNTYTYFKDKYCMFLFQNLVDGAISVQDLKHSQYAQFCYKPKIKQWLAQYGSNQIDADSLMALWQTDVYFFNMTLGQWGGDRPAWQQTCRKGHNLVVQLNFTKSHDKIYEKTVEPDSDLFAYEDHPISNKRNTMAWSRLDFSDDFSEVLIEEVQNDWLREAHDAYNFLRHPKNDSYYGYKVNKKLFNDYFVKVLKPMMSIWDEAILCATLEFLVEDIGVKHIYYYDYNTGSHLKSIEKDYGPPKSLYTKLPKKFGFKQVDQAPQFITEDRFSLKKLRKLKSPKWHYLAL